MSLMFARLGGVVGSNLAAFLLENYCESAFYLSGACLVFVGCLTYFIPKIHEKSSDVPFDSVKNDHRVSVLSYR